MLNDVILKDWNNTLCNVGAGHFNAMADFKSLYPEEYKFLNSMLEKRKKIRRNVKAMRTMSDYIYWGTLTYDNEFNDLLETTKRKQALTFLNKHFVCWLLVEEYGTKSGRYHIHFLAIKEYACEVNYEVMRSDWHSFIEIERIPKWKQERKIKYLTNYITKNIPRIRRNKRLIALDNDYHHLDSLNRCGFDFYRTTYYKNNADLLDLPF